MDLAVAAMVSLLTIPMIVEALTCPSGSTPTRETAQWVLGDDIDEPYYCSDPGCRVDICRPAAADRLQRDGLSVEYYETGDPNAAGRYVADRRTGRWVGWYRNGHRRFRGQWRSDDRVGHWIFWHANGPKLAEGHYRRDFKHGRWRSWDETGRLIAEEHYELGHRVGDPPSHDPCGPAVHEGSVRAPSLPVLDVVKLDPQGNLAHARLRNSRNAIACFLGHGIESPIYSVERWTGSGWRETGPGWCGVGVGDVKLAPGTATDFVIPLREDSRPLRIVVPARRHGGRGVWEPIRTRPIRVPIPDAVN